jgi:hypothetical protein
MQVLPQHLVFSKKSLKTQIFAPNPTSIARNPLIASLPGRAKKQAPEEPEKSHIFCLNQY